MDSKAYLAGRFALRLLRGCGQKQTAEEYPGGQPGKPQQSASPVVPGMHVERRGRARAYWMIVMGGLEVIVVLTSCRNSMEQGLSSPLQVDRSG